MGQLEPVGEERGRSKLLAYLALGVGILSIGFSAIFVRWAQAPGTVASFYRMFVPLIVLALPFFRNLRKSGPLPIIAIRLAIFGGLFFAADLTFWATGVTLSGATNPTLLANTAPLWVGLGALVFFRERLGLRFWIGLAAALAGALLILGLDSLQSASLGTGTFFGLLAGFFYGGYFLITQRGRERLDAMTYFWISAFSASLALFVLNLTLRIPLLEYSPRTYLSLLGLGLVSQAVGWLAINYSQGYLPATLVAPTLLAQPVVTALLAGPLLGETFLFWQVVGGIAVLAGVYLVHWDRAQSKLLR